jgi:hypothetical protein
MTSPQRREGFAAHNTSASTRAVLEQPRANRVSSSLMRKYEVNALDQDGSIRSSHHIGPASSLFENAVSAFARGTLIHTTTGPVAIEDLLPGDMIDCVDRDPQPVIWIGSTMIVPSAPGQSDEMKRLTRIMSDTFGVGRPMSDVLLGPGARLLREKHAYRLMTGSARLLLPASDFVDGFGAIEITPPSPVRVYHIALPEHSAIRAGGIEVESFHPGERAAEGVGQNMLSLFLSLFRHVDSIADFGPVAYPRASMELLEKLNAA